MNLIDVLVEELPKRGGWPNNATHCVCMADEHFGLVSFTKDGAPVFNNVSNEWTILTENDSSWHSFDFESEQPIDRETSVITRDQYEAALAEKNEGWIWWGGGECPVPCGTIVDVKHRCGAVSENQQAWPKRHKESNVMVNPLSNAGQAFWRHENSVMDIIAYRLHQPTKSEQVRADAWDAYAGIEKVNDEADMNECIVQEPVTTWSEEGLPPVGCVCERSWAGDEWLRCEILFMSHHIVVVKLKESGAEDAYNIGDVTFRPIRSETGRKRDTATQSMNSVWREVAGKEVNGKLLSIYEVIYDAIEAGKIPGVKLED